MILLIDHYDSFVYNLARYFCELGAAIQVKRPDEISLDDIKKNPPSHIVLSPGPCSPDENEKSNAIISAFGATIPLLGVCLGHQCIGHVFGGKIIRSPKPIHGKTSQITHNHLGIFKGLPTSFRITRYHSLLIERDTLPDSLIITATTDDGLIMGIQHKKYPIYGVQFHPEAHLSEHGHALLAHFLRIAQ